MIGEDRAGGAHVPRRWRAAAEVDAALDRGDLRYAISLAEELRIERGKPIPLDTASRFLPLIARESPRERAPRTTTGAR